MPGGLRHDNVIHVCRLEALPRSLLLVAILGKLIVELKSDTLTTRAKT